MNLSEALTAALPELPRTRLVSVYAPRLDPDLIIREDILDGMPSVSVLQRATAQFARVTPEQWQLLQLFDGNRTYEEIAEAAFEHHGNIIPVAELRDFADGVDSIGFWYKTPQEKNLAMSERLAAHRCRRSHGTTMSLASISFSAWDPDRYLTALDRAVGRFIYNRWFTLFAVCLFLFEASVFAAKWSTFGPDVHLYYQFTQKSAGDLAEFWILFFLLGFIHETAHGLSCKHYGGQVHSMGFLLLYLTPCFYCDITEVWISSTRMQRLIAIMAGIWIELFLCGVATVVWTNTVPGQWLHDFCYKIMLITGVAVVVLNVNPLLKLDGYYFLTECIRIPDLKERSTAFVSASVQRYVFRLPAELPMVSVRQVPLMVIYAIASGAYSYLMLFTVIRFAHNVFAHWLVELAFIPTGILAFIMFRSRLRTLREFLVNWYRHHFEHGALRATPVRLAFVAVALAVLFVPFWRDREDAYFVLEPARVAAFRTDQPSRVDAIYAQEGQRVAAGQLLAASTCIDVSGDVASSHSALAAAQEKLYQAEVNHAALGEAIAGEEGARRNREIAEKQKQQMRFTAPFAGVVITPNTGSEVSRIVPAGAAILQIADTSTLVARVFLPEPAIERIRVGDPVALHIPSRWRNLPSRLTAIHGPAVDLPAGVVESQQFAGAKLSSFYTSVVPVSAAGDLRPGMAGEAKVFGVRRSIMSRLMHTGADLLHSHFW